MAFTDDSDLFGSVHEDGINLAVRHIMRQRPSMFNYATKVFRQRPELFCHKIDAADKVIQAGNPLFTELEPVPVIASPIPIGLNFCLQFVGAGVDFHPDRLPLPPEIGDLAEQQFAVVLGGCGGLDCPSERLIDFATAFTEAQVIADNELAVGNIKENIRERQLEDPPTIPALPPEKLNCFCLQLFATGHFEWGGVIGSNQTFLKPKLDRLEIVDLRPEELESALECYLSTVLKLGILPRLMVPMEKMILDLTSEISRLGLQLNRQVTLRPAEAPAAVPHNPAVEDDQLKVFIDLDVTQLGA